MRALSAGDPEQQCRTAGDRPRGLPADDKRPFIRALLLQQLQPRGWLRRHRQSQSVVRERQWPRNQEPHAHRRGRVGSGDHAALVQRDALLAGRYDRASSAGEWFADVHDAWPECVSVHEWRRSELLQRRDWRLVRQRLSRYVLHDDAVNLRGHRLDKRLPLGVVWRRLDAALLRRRRPVSGERPHDVQRPDHAWRQRAITGADGRLHARAASGIQPGREPDRR